MFHASILTLFPDLFPGPLGASLAGKALAAGLWSLDATDIRAHATDKHRSVDDTPAGGGPGMVMRADVLARALDAVSAAGDPRPRLLMSPRGAPLTQARIGALVRGPGAVIVCGRFEGVDQRHHALGEWQHDGVAAPGRPHLDEVAGAEIMHRNHAADLDAVPSDGGQTD